MPMVLTYDRQHAKARSLEAWGHDVDLFEIVSQYGGFVMEGDGGLALFTLSAPKTYRVTVGFDPNKRGAHALATLNAAYTWVFENTDTETLVGYVAASETHWIAFSKQLAGGKLDKTEHGTAVFSITRERWLAARGG